MSIRTLSADFAFYGVLDFLQKSVNIFLLPLYTRVLSQAEYGNLDIIMIIISVLCVLVDLQFIAGFSRLYYDHRNAGKGKRFVGTTLISRLVGGTILAVVFIILGSLGALEFNFLPSFKANTLVWILATLSVPLFLTYDILLLQTRMLRWKKWFSLGALSFSLLSGTFSAFFVIVYSWGITGVILGLFLGKFVGVTLLSWGLRKEIKLCFDVQPFKELMKYSMPLVPGWWFAFGTAYLNRFFVYAELGAAENAILAVCMKVVNVVGFFGTSFQLAWQPLAMAYIGEEAGEVFYVRSMRLFIAGGLFSVFLLAAIIGPLLSILTPDSYNVVKYYFPLFAVGSLLSVCANNLQLGHQIAKTTHWISISSVVCITLNLIILIAFTKSYGIFAAGLAWVFSFTVKDVIMYVTAQKKHYIPYDKKSFVLLGLGSILLILLSFGSHGQYIPAWFFISIVSSMGIVIPWFVVSSLERKAIIAFLRQRQWLPFTAR